MLSKTIVNLKPFRTVKFTATCSLVCEYFTTCGPNSDGTCKFPLLKDQEFLLVAMYALLFLIFCIKGCVLYPDSPDPSYPRIKTYRPHLYHVLKNRNEIYNRSETLENAREPCKSNTSEKILACFGFQMEVGSFRIVEVADHLNTLQERCYLRPGGDAVVCTSHGKRSNASMLKSV